MISTPFDHHSCSIPAGEYIIGDDEVAFCRPSHSVTIAPFIIMQFAITNEQYAVFLHAGAYQKDQYWTESGLRWRKGQSERPPFWDDSRFNNPAQPLVGVAWYEAMAFARWYAEATSEAWRLPTEAEWEASATGSDRRMVNHAGQGLGKPLPVNQGHLAPCGAYNLLGNVWEWCSTRWGHNWQSLDYPYPYQADERENLEGSSARVMRGGSWFDAPQDCQPFSRARYLPGSRASNIGFRLVRDAD